MEYFGVEHKNKVLEFQKSAHSSRKKKNQTVAREGSRITDIKIIQEFFPDAKSILCCGARDDSEVRTFMSAGYDTKAIDVNGSSEYIMEMDLEEIDKYFGRDSFDILYLSHVLEHLSSAKEILSKIREISRLGVVVILPLSPHRPDPTIKHPSIFDVMKLQCYPDTPIEVLQNNSEIWNDFRGLEPYVFVNGSFRKGVTDYCEVCLFFKFTS